MEAKTIIKLIIFSTILLGAIFYQSISMNLNQNAIYYANQQPKVGNKDRTLFEISLHGHEGKVPESLTIFDMDDGNFIGVVNNGYRLNIDNCLLSEKYFYDFNEEGEIPGIGSHNGQEFEEVTLSGKNSYTAYKIRDSFVKPIVSYQKEPSVNLQWLYNLIYHF